MTKPAVTPFTFNSHSVRAITKADGTIWFVAKDVCETLGLTNVTEALRGLDEDERGYLRISEGTSPAGGNPNVNIISEPGLYKLIFRSTKPDAKAFTKWVTSEVLPAIRKTGSYPAPWVGGPTRVPALTEVPDIAKAFCAYADVAARFGLKEGQDALSASQAVRADYGVDLVERLRLPGIQSPSQVHHATPTELGKPYSISGQEVNKVLMWCGYQTKDENGNWKPTQKGLPYAVLVDTNKKHRNGTPVQQLRWLETVVNHLPISNAF